VNVTIQDLGEFVGAIAGPKREAPFNRTVNIFGKGVPH